jgi:NAD(P)-dependent dehydrogenase (short-subunit alcohol dehydrogenase family)
MKHDELVFIMNAAEIQPLAPVRRISIVDLETTFSTNFFGYVACLKALMAHQEVAGFKLRILNITTGATEKNHAGWAAYSVSKLALQRFCQFLVLENPNIILKEYDPGVFESPMQECIRAYYNEETQSSNLKPALEVAQDIADLVLLDWQKEG